MENDIQVIYTVRDLKEISAGLPDDHRVAILKVRGLPGAEIDESLRGDAFVAGAIYSIDYKSFDSRFFTNGQHYDVIEISIDVGRA